MLSIYRLARDRSDVADISVEDPAPGFARLRDAVDFEWAVRHSCGAITSTPIADAADVADMSAETERLAKELKLTKLQSAVVAEASQLFRILLHASRAATATTTTSPSGNGTTAVKKSDINSTTLAVAANTAASAAAVQPLAAAGTSLSRFQSVLSDPTGAAFNELPAFREFRLRVKKRLFRQDAELKHLPKDQMQQELSDAFTTLLQRYQRMIRVALALSLKLFSAQPSIEANSIDHVDNS